MTKSTRVLSLDEKHQNLLNISFWATLEALPSPFPKPLSMSDLLTVAVIGPGGGAHPMEQR
jgi:hypothetical protein